MSDDQSNNQQPGGEDSSTQEQDPIKNLKAEFGRKQDNIESELRKTQELLKMALAGGQSQPQPTHSTGKSIKDVWYTDEEAAAEMIERRTEDRIMKKLADQNQETIRTQQTFTEILRDFPEASDLSHPLRQKAEEVYAALSAEDRRSPLAMKLAVKEAAMDLGIKPKSKRSQDEADSFSLGTSRGAPKSKSRDDIDPAMLEFATRAGLNVNDPKVKERLKARAKRNFNTYE